MDIDMFLLFFLLKYIQKHKLQKSFWDTQFVCEATGIWKKNFSSKNSFHEWFKIKI